MKKLIGILFVIVGFTLLSFGQKSDSLKLMEAEIPAGYSLSSNLICKTVHASSFYNQTGLYASFSGNLIEKDFSGEAFHKGLVWGGAEKSSK